MPRVGPVVLTGARRVASSVQSSCRLAIVNLLVIVVASLLVLVHAALPPGQEDEIIVLEHLPGRRVHLQDFFWTGPEDAPQWSLDPEQMLTIYETRTVHHTATLYVPEESSRRPDESSSGDDRPRPTVDCTSCIDPTPTYLDVDQNIGVLVDGDDPDPRYWLLTVLRAGEDVPSKIELRLARLYKAAFTRQQQKHLGLLGPDIYSRKSPKREALVNNRTLLEELTTPSTTTESNLNDTTTTTTNQPITQRSPSAISLLHMRSVRISKSKRTLPIHESEDFEELALKPIEFNDTITTNSEQKANLKSQVDVGLVQVKMQNTSRTEIGTMRLIYSVHLGGKPVPAETAAKDMSLLSAQEVALELGAPVIIQSEPYLKESRPLALSRKRDAWLVAGAVSTAFVIVVAVLIVVFVLTKRKRAQSAVAAPPNRRILVKDEEYAPTTPGVDNTAYYTSETEGRTEVTGRTPGSQDTMDVDIRGEISSENELDTENHRRGSRPWDSREYAEIAKKGPPTTKRSQQQHQQQQHQQRSIEQQQQHHHHERPQSGDSVDSAGMLASRTLEGRDSNNTDGNDEATNAATGSPHSYLSMPSCKQFPNMRSVEPLSKVLEPVVVKHLDLELDSPEMQIKDYDFNKRNGDGNHFARSASETKDPGVLGPIVWDLKRKRAVEGGAFATSSEAAEQQMESGRTPHGPVGRARRRLNELLEDSFSLFGSRDSKPTSATATSQRRFSFERRAQQEITTGQSTIHHSTARTYSTSTTAEYRGKSAHVSHVTSPTMDGQHRPRTSLPDGTPIPETGQHVGPQPRGAWGSRPLSAGPFHRPNLPEVEVVRVLADSQLRPEDPAVPLISAIKKELGKFTYD